MDVDTLKLTLKVSANPTEETRALFAYLYSSLATLVHHIHSPAEIGHSSDRQSPEPTHPMPTTNQPRAAIAEATPPLTSDVKKSKQEMVTTVDVDQVIARFRSIVGSGKYAEQLANKILLNLVDVGGQPGFLEMLPLPEQRPRYVPRLLSIRQRPGRAL